MRRQANIPLPRDYDKSTAPFNRDYVEGWQDCLRELCVMISQEQEYFNRELWIPEQKVYDLVFELYCNYNYIE